MELLIITIIVLLILAGVVINMTLGNDGIINKAQGAVDAYKNAQEKEEIEIAKATNEIERLFNNRDNKKLMVDDIYNWLNAGNITIQIEDLINGNIISKLMSSESAVDYMIANENIENAVVNSSSAITKLANNEYALNKVIENDKWRTAILGSNQAIAGLDNSEPVVVPNMTSSSTPSGNVFASIAYGDLGIVPYKVFDGVSNNGENDYWNPAAGATYKDQYIGYSFTKPIWLYKILVNTCYNNDSEYVGKQKCYYVIEGTNTINDDNSWIVLTNEKYEGKRTIVVNNDNKTKYQHYRLRITKTDGDATQNGSGNSIILSMQFYGK